MHVVFSAGPNWSVAFDPKDEAVVRESLTKAGLEAGMLGKSLQHKMVWPSLG